MSVQASTPHTSAPGSFRITGWRFLAMIVGFFLVVIGVDVSFAVVAYRTHPGEVSVTPYEDGLVYNKKLAQMQAQDALGWRAAAGPEAGKVIVVLEDKAGRPLSGLAVTGKLERPATEAGRITPRFAETGPGRYEAAEAGLAGAWDLTAEAHDRAGHSFELERRLTWP
jgi:nitrogen fixation protein FixH